MVMLYEKEKLGNKTHKTANHILLISLFHNSLFADNNKEARNKR